MTAETSEKKTSEGATPKFRIDAPELTLPKPHAFDLPQAADIRRLAKWLERDDVTLGEFGEKLARYPGLSRYVIAFANYSAVRREGVIREPVHAAAFLGVSSLRRILEPLTTE